MVGVDVGGTFVDFALCDSGGEMAVHKVPAEPADLAGSIMRGIADLAVQRGTDVRTFLGGMDLVVHGTTVATNAILTGAGSRTGLITTKGTRDALEMRRGIKEEPLDNKYEPPRPLVPRYLRLPVHGRVDWSGNVLEDLDAGSLEAAVQALKAHEVEAVALCLMHAYANDAHERRVAERLRERAAGCVSHRFLGVAAAVGLLQPREHGGAEQLRGSAAEVVPTITRDPSRRRGIRGTTAHHELGGRADGAGGDCPARCRGALVWSGGGAGGGAGSTRAPRERPTARSSTWAAPAWISHWRRAASPWR